VAPAGPVHIYRPKIAEAVTIALAIPSFDTTPPFTAALHTAASECDASPTSQRVPHNNDNGLWDPPLYSWSPIASGALGDLA
jgi:hypothetical protein